MPKHQYTCIKCGKPYTSYKLNSKWCSRDCMNNMEKPKKQCLVCKKEFKPHQPKQKYCSKPCQGVAQTRLPMKECPSCKKIFKPRWSGRIYCSVKCRPANMENKIQTNCQNCGKEMFVIPSRLKDGRGKYCSHECFASRTGQTSCKHCGKTLTLYLSDIKENNFCDQHCKSEWMSYTFSGENAWAWRGGHDWYRGDNWKSQRRKALKRDNYTCALCGANDEDSMLMVHHIVPFRFFGREKFKTANRLVNLQTLCNSCHSKQEAHFWHEVPKQFDHLL